MKKKILALCLIVVLAVTAITGATLAYFTDTTETKENVFTVGNVNIELDEPSWTESGSVDAPDVYPGEALKKDPTVTNTGANPCFVRVSVTGLDDLGADNMITYETGYQTGALGEDWTLHNDGYFYYTKVLAAGEDTTALFEQIRIPTTLTNVNGEEYTEIYSVDVYAEAVQAQGAMPSWSAVQNMTVDQIAAWFTTCMSEA